MEIRNTPFPSYLLTTVFALCLSALLYSCGGGGGGSGGTNLDPSVDHDGDGWTINTGDCCEDSSCGNPALVNPGAAEIVGNGVNDDCNVATSDLTNATACSTAAKFTSVTPQDMAGAMELCQLTTLDSGNWGLINAEFLNADGSTPSAAGMTAMTDSQSAILENYGVGGVIPTTGSTMAGMSNGMMRDANDPGYVAGVSTSFGRTGSPPSSYLAAHGGSLPSSAGCSGSCPSGSGANDSINLRLTLRVPTNAVSFSYDWRFFSVEYWTYSCTAYNDYHLALLQTTATGIPADGNISYDSLGNPVSVNNSFFEICTAKGCYTCPMGTSELNGTGMEVNSLGGGTAWLTTTAPVTPGEVITLDLMVFDVSDGILDSLVLYDNFRWNYATP